MNNFEKLSEDELSVLYNISVGFDKEDSYSIYKKLEKIGLIEQTGIQKVGRDSFGAVMVPIWEMPLSVHIDWCKYCAELPEEAN